MILVVCPNLAIDHTLRVETLSTGRVHRSRRYERRAGGKGVNAARALNTLGEEPLLCGFAGGTAGQWIELDLANENIRAELVPMKAENRTCVIAVSDDGQATVINEEGPTVARAESEALRTRVQHFLGESQAVALMGSLPPGLPSDFYAEIVTAARERDVPCLVDASGPALESALRAKPSYVTPNEAEAEALLGGGVSDWITAAREIRNRGAEVVLISRGAEDAILSGPEVNARLAPPAVRVVNATGAGDALAAGLLAAHLRGKPLREIAVLGIAAAVASVQHGYGRFRPSDVRTESIDFREV